MTKRVAMLAVLIVIACVSLWAQRGSSSPRNIQGVWRVVEQTINGRTLTDENLGLGYHIYSAGYYAAVRESGVPPRPSVSDVDNATAAQLLAMWGPFVAQFGTYEISGDLMTEQTLVAKNPSNMGSNRQSSVRRFKLEGNTLITEPYNKTEGRTITLKMVRVE